MLEAALDCIIMMDHHGKVVEFNPAAEQTFGHRRAAAIGHDLADLIIPEALRERHRSGLARYLATGENRLLGRRLEFSALHANGTEFPVEIAITRIPTDGPPLFTAYLRDISGRTRSERHRNLRMKVMQVLAQGGTISETAGELLRAICQGLDWDAGFFWILRPESDALLVLESWSPPGVAITQLEAASRQQAFARGEGLPGCAWASGEPVWLLDAVRSTNFPRAASAAEEGLHGAFACPLLGSGKTLGVIEFFSRHVREPDPDLLESMATVAGLIAQVMERKQAEDALRQSETRSRALMEQAPFSVQVFAPDGRTVRVNRAWEDLWGIKAEASGRYNILKDPQLEAKGIAKYVRRAFAGQAARIPPIEYNPNETIPGVTRQDDPRRWLSAVIYPLKDAAGQVREVVLIHEDITARTLAEEALKDSRDRLRNSEEKLRLLADTIPQLAWMARADGYVFWFNRRWYEYTGTTPEQMAGWGWQSVHDPEVLPEVVERWRASLQSGEPFEMVFPLRGADGEFRPFLTRMSPLRDQDGRIVYWCGTNTDISEIKRMEDALRDTDRRKDEFLATLAHELRNPLAPIRNSLQILKMPRVGAATTRQAREMMERQVHHLVRLVDDLLDVSRVMRGKIELRKEPVELAAVLARALETAEPLIDIRGHELDVSLPPDSLLVHVDPVRLSQAIANVLMNAAKYIEGSGTIAVTAGRKGDEAFLRVRDNGIGIDPDMLPQVFDLFVQADHAASRSQGGLGLGLTLVKNIVEMHDGNVEAHSAGLGKGSEFVLRLPLCLAQPQERETSEPDERQPTAAPAGHRLLVVDDNEDAATSLATMLRLQGHDVRVAHDGVSALEVASELRPALILLDLGMPGMDGYEVARRIRQRAELRNTVLAALTGWGQQEDRRRTAEAGFDHHLVKPVDPKTLENLLTDLNGRGGA